MTGTKFVLHTLLFRTQQIDWFRSRQYSLTEFDIFGKTFASHVRFLFFPGDRAKTAGGRAAPCQAHP
jgi:hypothetical protein